MAASIINTDFIRKHLAQTVLTVLGFSGVVLIFLPFTFGDEVPATLFFKWLPPPLPPFRGLFNVDALFWFLAPFVLSPLAISTGYLRWLLTGRLSCGEAVAGYAFALLAAGPLVLVEVVDAWGRPAASVWVALVYLLIAFGAGAGFVIQNLRNATPSVPNALVAMQLVYLPIALFFILIAFSHGSVRIGLYFAIVTVLAYSAQIVMAAKRLRQALIFFVPLALVWAGHFVWAWLEG